MAQPGSEVKVGTVCLSPNPTAAAREEGGTARRGQGEPCQEESCVRDRPRGWGQDGTQAPASPAESRLVTPGSPETPEPHQLWAWDGSLGVLCRRGRSLTLRLS